MGEVLALMQYDLNLHPPRYTIRVLLLHAKQERAIENNKEMGET